MNRFIEYHLLTPYSGVLLNRGDAGFAKTLPINQETHTRVSSQCIKYHVRNYGGEFAIRDVGDMSVRSRQTFRKMIAEPLTETYPTHLVAGVVAKLKDEVLDEGGDISEILKSEDPIGEMEESEGGAPKILGRQEIDYLRGVAEELVQTLEESASKDDIEDAFDQYENNHAALKADLQDNLEALSNSVGLDGAMFGRMVTSDVLSRVNSAVHVAHAHTVQPQQRESDYFTAIDQLTDGNASAHNSQKELTSGLFYKYFVVDVPLLQDNLGGDEALTESLLQRFTQTIYRASVGAKRGSTAPYSRPVMMLAEMGDVMPYSLSKAFTPTPKGTDVHQIASQQMIDELSATDSQDGAEINTSRRYAATVDVDTDLQEMSVAEIAEWIANNINA